MPALNGIVQHTDYRLCDVCNCKTFYDAGLNYNRPDEKHRDWWLDRVGDWAVICEDCAKAYEVVVRPRSDGMDAPAES